MTKGDSVHRNQAGHAFWRLARALDSVEVGYRISMNEGHDITIQLSHYQAESLARILEAR